MVYNASNNELVSSLLQGKRAKYVVNILYLGGNSQHMNVLQRKMSRSLSDVRSRADLNFERLHD